MNAVEQLIRNSFNIILSYFKHYNSINGFGVVIKKSKILGNNNSFDSRTMIRDSTINGNVSVNNGTTIINSILSGYNKIGNDCGIGNSAIGMYSYINSNGTVNNVQIGKFCSIGPDFKVGLGKHPVHLMSTSPLFYSKSTWINFSLSKINMFDEYSPTFIANDVWIGANVFLVEGIKIGNGAVIGAGSVVTKDVPDYAIVGGVPAKIIRYRFPEDIIKSLLELKWWDKDINWLEENLQLFQKPIEQVSDIFQTC